MSQSATSSRRRILPGFGLSLGYTTFYLSLIVLIPLSGLFFKSLSLSLRDIYETITNEFVVAAFKVSFGASLIAAAINGVFGLIVAWVLVRYRFPGRRFFDAIIDLPFALPTAVAGLTFSQMYAPNGWLGRIHIGPLNLNFTGSFGGIVVVLIFVGLPFTVRTVQPVLQDLERDVEEAAGSLGASRWYTFRRVIFPHLLPAWLAGLALSFARAVGEYGSVIFISSNQPGKTEILPVQIINNILADQVDRATAIAGVMLLTSLGVLVAINGIEWLSKRREERDAA